MKRAWLLFFLFALIRGAPDNEGKEFILCYMENIINHSYGSNDIELYITTSSNNQVYVNVTTPLYDPSFLQSKTVTRGQITFITIPHGIRGSGNELGNKGVNIVASEEVTVYSVNKEMHSTDAFIGYPVDTLSTDYVIVTWSTMGTLMVVATEDGTDVSIAFSSVYTQNDVSYNGVTYGAGDMLNLTLDKWQTFHVYTTGDLTGTRVTSSHVVAVMSGSKKTSVKDSNVSQGGTADHLVEQMVPVQSWGKEFLTISSPDRTIGDFFKVVAAEDSTNVTILSSTSTSSTSLNAGEFELLNIDTDVYNYISADKGIIVVMFSKTAGSGGTGDAPNGGDPAMSLLVPVPLFGADYTFSTVETPVGNFTNYLVIVTKNATKAGLVLDNVQINGTATWSSVASASDDYVVTTIDINPGVHSVYNTDPTSQFLCMAFGNAPLNSYAYASGLRLSAINTPCNTTTTTAADGLDNDCDGSIDEENDNGIDDDGDGLVDEDLAAGVRVNGIWGSWGSWSSCSATCGNGIITREKPCDDPAPQNNGLYCVGSGTESQNCTAPSCPVDGNWGSWSNWTSCSASCGNGTISRTRDCDSPPTSNGGADCSGSGSETGVCTTAIYCLPSVYGNLDLNCGSGQFGCAAGVIQCLDIAFRCDGQVDCDDGSDENKYFTGCDVTVCGSRSGAGKMMTWNVVIFLFVLLGVTQMFWKF